MTLEARWLRSLVAEPGADGRLFAITNEGRLVVSPDHGVNWTYLALPDDIAGSPLQYRGAVTMDYSHPSTLYIGAGAQGVWRSNDGGVTWAKNSAIQAGPVAVSFDDPNVLWAGIPWDNVLQSTVARSDDGGQSWHAAGGGISGNVVSPILIDPTEHTLRYLISQGDRGGASFFRATNGLWTLIQNAPVGTPPSGGPGLGLALDADSRTLYVAGNDGVLSRSRNYFAVDPATITWTAVHQFSGGYLPIPLAVGAGPNDGALYLSLYDWFSGQGRTLRSDDGGVTWAALHIPPIGVPDSVECYNGIVDGGFEDGAAWQIRPNPVPAQIAVTPVHSGGHSMRTGIVDGGDNVVSYSPVEQTVKIPALPDPGVASAVQLRFWHYNVYGDGAARDVEPSAAWPQTEDALLASTAPADFFYAIVIRGNGSIDWLLRESVNSPRWHEAVIDLNDYAGQTIRLQFGTYNNGSGGVSRTFIDDVVLQICPPESALILPHGWADRVIGRPESKTIYATVGDLLYRSDDAGRRWHLSGTARPAQMLLGGDPDLLYAGDGYPCYAGGPSKPMWRSADGGVSWQQVAAGIDLKPLALHPVYDWIYAAGCNGPYLSKDGGASFTHQPNALFGLYDVYFLAPVGSDWTTVWVGGISEGGGGAVLVSRDGGASWTRSTPLEPEIGWLGDLGVDRADPAIIYAPAYLGFFESDNDGASWRSISTGLASVVGGDAATGLFAVFDAPGRDHKLLLGTARGLYYRLAESAAWQKLEGKPFDAMRVDDLLILDAAPTRLYVTTSMGVFMTTP